MKIYVRKIKDHDITHQISIRKNIVEEFFENNETIKVKGKKSKEERIVKILPATDPRFNAEIEHLIATEGGVEVGDIFVMYKENSFYTLEVIKQNDPKFAAIQEMCEADERHTLLYVDTGEAIVDLNNKERFKKWLTNEGYSESSVIQYSNQISLASKESLAKNIIDCNLYEVTDLNVLKDFIQKIKETEEFKNRKQNGNNINEAALNLYLTFAEEIFSTKILDETPRVKNGFNKIYYGIPGCGKSFVANQECLEKTNENKELIVRTTFYPDYTNSDFIGQIIPKVDDSDKNSVIYDIQDGPFTEALKLAIDNPSNMVCLIIEEINRGNAAAIFGDIFQLLDRNENGECEYGIKNYIISKYLSKNCINQNYDFYDLKIPSNLILIGTMNTSDQNVFTLDTAFKRRWETEYIPNDVEHSLYKDKIVPNLNVTWSEFVKKINNTIISSDDILGVNGEDKQLGAYFISGQEWKKIENSNEGAKIFANKVISYIWEDVAKINKSAIFKKDYKCYEEVLHDFMNKTKVNEVFAINFNKENVL